MAQKQSALKAAMNGDAEKLSDKQTKGALSEAITKLTNVTRKAEISKEAVINTGTNLMHSAETLGSLFMSSMAEGFLGPEKLKLGGVDLRAPVGLVTQGYGLYQILSGESGGNHALALGNGVTGSWLASVAVDAGKALRDRRNGGALPPASTPPTGFRGEEPMVHIPALEGPSTGHLLPATTTHAPQYQATSYPRMTLIPEPTVRVSGPTREVTMPQESESQSEIAGPRQRLRRAAMRRASNRFPRASSGAEEGESE